MVVRKYQKLLPANNLSNNEKSLLSEIEGDFRVVISSRDIMKGAFLYMLLKERDLYRIELLSLYDLIDIYLGKNPTYERLLDINPDVLLLYAGYEEFENKRTEEAFAQVAEHLRVNHKKLWLFYRGSKAEMEGRLPQLYQYTVRRKYNTLDMNKTVVGEEYPEL